MATSELKHYVRFDSDELNDEDFVDTGMARRAVGNVLHVSDQYAQHRISVPPDVVLRADPNIDPKEADTRYRIFTSPPFDMHLRSDGTTYPFRVRVRISSNHATYTATFYAVLASADDSFSEHFVTSDATTSTTVTSTGYTRKTLGPLWMDVDQVARAQKAVPSRDSVGGEFRTALWLRAQLVIYAEVDNTAAEARLAGLEGHEYLTP